MKQIARLVLIIFLCTFISGCIGNRAGQEQIEYLPDRVFSYDPFARPEPDVKVNIRRLEGIFAESPVLIYEDDNYTYSINEEVDDVLLEYDDGRQVPLAEAIAGNQISIEDLILNFLRVKMRPKNNPLDVYGFFGDAFGPDICIYAFLDVDREYICDVYPSNSFMYIYRNPGRQFIDDAFERGDPNAEALAQDFERDNPDTPYYFAVFALDELKYILTQFGRDIEENIEIPSDEIIVIEGIRYIKPSACKYLGLFAEIQWGYGAYIAWTWFTYLD